MAIQFEEYPDSRKMQANPASITLHYWLSGIHDHLTAYYYVIDNTYRQFSDLWRQNISYDPKGNSFFDIEVEYGPLPDCDIGEVSVSFDTTGSTSHITQAKEHIDSHVVTGTAPNHNGAINVGKDGPKGVDIVTSQFSWTENWTLPVVYASFASAMILKDTTGRVNYTSFRGFGPKQVRFDGASISASSKDPNKAMGSYKFTQSDDTTDAVPAFKTGIRKSGWEYLWAEYEKKEDTDAKRIIQPPVAVYVERVYDVAEFGLLGIGTGMLS